MLKKLFSITGIAFIAAGALVGCNNNIEDVKFEKPNIYIHPDETESTQTNDSDINKNTEPTWNNDPNHTRDEKPNIYIYPDIESEKPNIYIYPDTESMQESDSNTEPTWNTDLDRVWIDKPNVYLYPSSSTPISVSLSDPSDITCSYPEYKDGWTITADKDGTLTDIKTGKQYYALYYESESEDKIDKSTGFCIEGEKTSEFLEEVLTTLGLNFKERQEFIIYWLPRLEANKYNYIKFLTEDEIAMKLNVNPKPDSIIRVFMAWEGLDDKIKIKEQELTPVTRDGYTVVEWGGIELKK